MRKFQAKLRYFWHELYYKLASAKAVEFGMICRNVVEQIDLHDKPSTWTQWFRLQLHLSLCQACNNYLKASRALKKAIKELVRGSSPSVDVKKINDELLKKFGR